MKQTITKSMFRDAFKHMNRAENFTYEGLGALYDYLEDQEPEYDLDVIELCCSFSEYDLDEALEEYNCSSFEELCEDRIVIEVNEVTFIIGE